MFLMKFSLLISTATNDVNEKYTVKTEPVHW